MLSEHFHQIDIRKVFRFLKNCVEFDIHFPCDYEQFKNVTGVLSIVTDAMSCALRMKMCLFREQSEKQSAKWDQDFNMHMPHRCITSYACFKLS